VPDATLLPQGVDRLYVADPDLSAGLRQLTLHATERLREGDSYVYDLDVRDPDGVLVERWEGLRLRAVRKQDGTGPWVAGLLGPYLERRTDQVLPAALWCAVRPDDSEGTGVKARRKQTAGAAEWALGRSVDIRYRPDGKPEVGGGVRISSAHGAGVTFVLASDRFDVACDVERAVTRSAQDWERLLGPQQYALAQLLVRERGEDLSVAATRVWGAVECLRKLGRAKTEPLTAAEPRDDRWVVFRSGAAHIATFPTTLVGVAEPVVFTMSSEGSD
jgi:enediyne polyketide synthase